MNNQLPLPAWHVEHGFPYHPTFQATPQLQASTNEERPNGQMRNKRQLSGGRMARGQVPLRQKPLAPMPLAPMSLAPMSLGQMPFAPMPLEQMPLGQTPHGQTPNEQLLNGLVPNGQMPHGQMSNDHMLYGKMYDEQLSNSPILSGQMPSGQYPNGHLSHEQMPNGQHMLSGQTTNRQTSIKPEHLFAGRDDELSQWSNTAGAVVEFGLPLNQHMMSPFSFDYPHQTTPLHMHGSFPMTMATTSGPPRHDSLALQSQSDFSFAKFREFPQQAQQQLAVDSTPSPGAKLPPVQIPRNSVSGPASKNYDIPARPKPGRKPIDTDPKNKRKLQNRMAQRGFRDRRAQKQQKMEEEMEAMTKEHALAIQAKDAEIQARDQQIQHCHDVIKSKDTVIQAREREISMLQQQLSYLRSNGPSPSTEQPSAISQSYVPVAYTAVPTPPEDDHDEMETDFTAMFSSKKTAFSLSDDHQMGGSPIGSSDHCGFCDRPENCLCAQAADESQKRDLDESKKLPPLRNTLPRSLSHQQNSSTPSYLEAPTRASGPTSGPGSCDMCRADPEKARQCQELAKSTQFSAEQQAASRQSATSITTMKNSDPRLSCSDFLTRAKDANVQLGPEVYGRVHVYPYSHRAEGGKSHSPAMEIDMQDAAQALANMSQGLGPGTG